MTEAETPLSGGRTTSGVVRVGATVRRPPGPNAGFVRQLLRHVESRGFTAAPRYLGVDDQGRESFTFVAGHVPRELGEFSDAQLETAARLLREFHEATRGSELTGAHEVVCHGDASPCNFVFVDDMPVALIDFDAAHAGRRREDLGYAAWLWLDIGSASLSANLQGARLARFVRAYGGDVADAVSAVLDAQAELASRPCAAEATRQWAKSCAAWVLANRDSLGAAVHGDVT
ncbi:MAG: phosphotransferase [Polyangiaceae bacterium]